MTRTTRTILSLTTLASLVNFAPSAHAADVPEWVRPALRYAVDHGYVTRESFRPNQPMPRATFKRMMAKAFGGGYRKTEGDVTAREVSAALVRALGRAPVATALSSVQSPDGWDPGVSRYFGTEVVARELGLRRDRDTGEESYEASAGDEMRQADVVWAMWQAKTSPDTWSADSLRNFALDNYGETRRGVVKFALSLVGKPYVWGGEWPSETPSSYPFGAQSSGGFDCSGFIWYVLREKSSSWAPARPYVGWDLDERASYQMAAATPRAERLSFRELRPADIVFFATAGRDARPSDVYHAGLYLGKGWMIHSSGGRAGISLAPIGRGAWWNSQIVFGRRVIN